MNNTISPLAAINIIFSNYFSSWNK